MSGLLPLVQAELRLRLRRLSTVLVLLLTLVLSWMVVVDPRTGFAMMVIQKARTVYESGTVAFGSACIASVVLNLFGFYLVRGRSSLDLHSGCAGLIATTPTGNLRLLASRWLGSMAYLMLLQLALVLGGCVLQWIRGEGPLQPWVFVQTYAWMLTPTLMAAASFALLADAWGPLVGRKGDVAYFLVWMAQFAVLPATLVPGHLQLSPLQALDASGMAAAAAHLAVLMHTNTVAIGGSTFDPGLPMRHFPEGFWGADLVALRLATAVLALVVAALAVPLFHRFDPRRVRTVGTSGRSWPKRLMRALLGPARWPALRLLRLAPRIGGAPGAYLAEVSLTLLAHPWAVLAIPVLAVLGQVLPPAKLPALVAAGCCLWGLAISDLSSRDFSSGTMGLVAAVPGGDQSRRWRQYLCALGVGLLFTVPVAVTVRHPELLLTLMCGLVLVSALASLLGQLTRGGRSFLALFLFGFYVILQVPESPWLDLFGFNGAATSTTRATSLGVAALALVLANRRLLARA
ncbi:hypothetical protein ACQ859_18545 [Roseateles chitinivorans]|uniref:hypothetical protein n=1 Tax=Roseateles chitinivorans TaxID=2917965 RepID=UPI003D6687FF